MRRNPLTFDNRFDPEPMTRYPRSRAVASIVTPPRQRAQVQRLAESPHTFRVVVLDSAPQIYAQDLKTLSQPGCITLVIDLENVQYNDLVSRFPGTYTPASAGVALYSAFTYLHRLGDVLYAEGILLNAGARNGLMNLFNTDLDRLGVYIPSSPVTRAYGSEKTHELAKKVSDADVALGRASGWDDENTPYAPEYLHGYIASHTNSDMSRRGIVSEVRWEQCVADWVALSELPAARARPGRGEPWLLFPPRPGEYHPEVARRLKKYAETINTYFPAFIESLFDDFGGAVFRI